MCRTLNDIFIYLKLKLKYIQFTMVILSWHLKHAGIILKKKQIEKLNF